MNLWEPWTQNLYTYAGNNPVRYTDPTGHAAEDMTCAIKGCGGPGGGGGGGGPTGVGGVMPTQRQNPPKLQRISGDLLKSEGLTPGLVDGTQEVIEANPGTAYQVVNPNGASPQATFNDKYDGHIFRNADGHLPNDTQENRQSFVGVTSAENYFGKDARGNDWYSQPQGDGSQVWVEVRGGVIRNAGVNSTPNDFSPQTGLKSGPS